MVFVGSCSQQTHVCTAKTPAPITAVYEIETRRQTDVWRACFKLRVDEGEWTTSYLFDPDSQSAAR